MASAQGAKDCEKIKAHDQGEERFPKPDTKCIGKETEGQDCEKIAPETGEKKHEIEKEKKNNKIQKDKETAERDRELKEGAQEMEEEVEEEKKDKKEKKEKKEKGESKDEKKKEREGAQDMEEDEEKKDKKEKKEKKEKGGSKDEKKKEKKEKDPTQYSAVKLKQKLEKIDAKLQKMLLQKEDYMNLLKQAEQRHLEEEKPEPCEGPNETVKIKEKGLENLHDGIDSLSISNTKVEVTITEVSKEGKPTVCKMCSKIEETTVRPVGN